MHCYVLFYLWPSLSLRVQSPCLVIVLFSLLSHFSISITLLLAVSISKNVHMFLCSHFFILVAVVDVKSNLITSILAQKDVPIFRETWRQLCATLRCFPFSSMSRYTLPHQPRLRCPTLMLIPIARRSESLSVSSIKTAYVYIRTVTAAIRGVIVWHKNE